MRMESFRIFPPERIDEGTRNIRNENEHFRYIRTGSESNQKFRMKPGRMPQAFTPLFHRIHESCGHIRKPRNHMRISAAQFRKIANGKKISKANMARIEK